MRETSDGSNKVHATSSVVVKDFRSSVFQLNTIKEEEQQQDTKKYDLQKSTFEREGNRALERAGARSLDRLSILNRND